jgi:hypothetical protein
MDMPDLGDMVITNWIADWNKPDPGQDGIAEYRIVCEMIGDKSVRSFQPIMGREAKMKRG